MRFWGKGRTTLILCWLKTHWQLLGGVANTLGGSYFTLDETFQVGRVVMTNEDGSRLEMDFSAMQGPTLLADLEGRDFTINAMAIELHTPTMLLDPLGGAPDLLAKRLQTCSPTSLMDDPVRALRAVRMSAKFGLSFTPETRSQIPAGVELLENVSVERLRDEFFKVLDAPKPATSLRILDHFGILSFLIPELEDLKGVEQSPPHIYDVWEHSLHTVQKMEDVLQVLDKHYAPDNEMGGDVFTGLLSLRLGRYRQQFGEVLSEDFGQERSHRALLFLGALCHDFTKPRHRTLGDDGKIHFTGHADSGAEVMRQRAIALKLSRAEIKLLSKIMQYHDFPISFTWHDKHLSKKKVYRFWRDTGGAGVDVCLVATADVLSVFGHTLPQSFFEQHLEIIRKLLDAYWEHPEQVAPPALLDGNDLMQHFKLKPGPELGGLLEALREAQAVGDVTDKAEALDYIAARLSKS